MLFCCPSKFMEGIRPHFQSATHFNELLCLRNHPDSPLHHLTLFIRQDTLPPITPHQPQPRQKKSCSSWRCWTSSTSPPSWAGRLTASREPTCTTSSTWAWPPPSASSAPSSSCSMGSPALWSAFPPAAQARVNIIFRNYS